VPSRRSASRSARLQRAGTLQSMEPQTLDHVALWVADRDRIAAFGYEHLGMHEISRTDAFTLVGADARRGKLTLFAADGPRAPGPLRHVALRVSSLPHALAELPAGIELERPRPGEAYFDVAEGLRLGLVEADTSSDYDLDHVALWSARPAETAAAYRDLLGFADAPAKDGVERVEVGGAHLEFHRGEPREPERPLLHHVAVLVESAEAHIQEAREVGVEIADIVDAENTYAVFLWAPERVKVELVEHKPTFSLV
jgi:catechol 2,3-dioxygenase-like lactoylglutathione lyase family enzyme